MRQDEGTPVLARDILRELVKRIVLPDAVGITAS